MQFQKPVCPMSRASHPLWGLGACWGAGAAPSLRITMEGRPADRKPDQPQRRGRWVTWAWATVIAPVTQHDTQFFKGRDENSAENCSGNGPAVKPRGRASPWAVGDGGGGGSQGRGCSACIVLGSRGPGPRGGDRGGLCAARPQALTMALPGGLP